MYQDKASFVGLRGFGYLPCAAALQGLYILLSEDALLNRGVCFLPPRNA
jgi:hypothetical protein